MQETIRSNTETEISGFDIEKLNLHLKKQANLVNDCDLIISDCTSTLESAAKQEDIKSSKELKARINDAAANKEIFELKVQVIAVKLKQLKHEEALKLCGDNPKLPYGMDPVTFGHLLDHIYEGTMEVAAGSQNTPEGNKIRKQFKAVIKSNPCLEKYVNRK